MKDFLISFLVVAVLVGAWLFFDSYSKEEVNSMADSIENTIIPYVKAEDWSDSIVLMDRAESRWNSYKKIATLFLEADNIYEIDSQFARAVEYAEAADVSNTTGELKSLAGQLRLLHSREKITTGNIL